MKLIKLTVWEPNNSGKPVWVNTEKICLIERSEVLERTRIIFESRSVYVKETVEEVMDYANY